MRILDPNSLGAQNRAKLEDVITETSNVSDDCEETVQKATIALLRANGYTVLQTSVRKRMQHCPQCGAPFWPVGGTAQDKGIPDLLVRPEDSNLPLWLGIEVKGAKTRLSPEQKQ